MIGLNLQQFGGGGGGSSGKGGGRAFSGGRGSASGSGINAPAQNKSGNERNRSSAESENESRGRAETSGRIVRETDIRSSETYTLFRVSGSNNETETEYKDKSGEDLRTDIAYDRLTLNRKEKVWVSRKGNKYVIRKKK